MKIRLPRKIKKKYGKAWKMYLSIYIFKKSTHNFAKVFLNTFQSVLNLTKIIQEYKYLIK